MSKIMLLKKFRFSSYFFSVLSLFIIQTASALEIIGEWQQGAVIVGKVPSDTTVVYNERTLQLTPKGQFVLGLGRDAGAVAIITTITNGVTEQHTFDVKPRTYNIQRVEGVPQKTIEPSKEQTERIKKEALLTSGARKTELPLDFFTQKFQWPVIGPISGVYGSQRIYNGIPGSPHVGVDIAKPEGTMVHAPAGGVVTLAHNDMFLSGGTLIIDHGHGLSSTFIHLSKILVKKGDNIIQGQNIALIGKTGRASGPHLHWAMNWFTERVDPQLLVADMPKGK